MRVILGLAALAASVSAQTTVTPSTNNGNFATPPVAGNAQTTALASISLNANTAGGAAITTVTPTGFINVQNALVNTNTFAISVVNSVSAIVWTFGTNAYTGQIQYRWAPNYGANFATQYNNNQLSSSTYTCDPCSGGTPVSCNVNGPGTTGLATGTSTSSRSGYACASLTRTYTMTNLAVGASANSFAVQLLDLPSGVVLPDTSSYSFIVSRAAPTIIVGDPQIVGMQGQDFQVHGVPDEIFNIVTYPTLQINARFTYLESGVCHDNFTACFAHPGTYISEEGIRIGKDKVRVSAGSFKKGLTVHVNGKKIKSNTDLKNGAIEMVNHRRVVVHTDVMRVAISNSDNFMNQELELMDDKLVSLGAKRVTLKDNQKFHSEVPLHGLQGQTWRNVEYPSGLEYEGSIMDYHVVDGNLFGTDFVFNQFQS